MATESPDAPPGLFDSLKALSASLAGIVHTRLALLSNDLAEEQARLTVYWAGLLVALFCFGVGVVLLAMLIVAAFWDTHRLLALGVMGGAFLAAGLGAGAYTLRWNRTRPRPFDASLGELAKDRQQLTPRS
ncbi:MAG: hypothetical protein B7Y26_09065 [Hydrogenophilales bacterium 16-64-46]|nr:MAG: hypothetical protein B7Z32_12045 [Hydrogenophilales bacterium 12-64-13]OYZ05109.1 MAG: hypothetical protein B7Y26_09065 [Hydrogenophilales bacterium 16-64-46]OZA37927.1 MAG: hypothetical protein B7X87_08995 [Hydrogenophilales bacterium 17-64-34]HQT00543.1 phage holin family protein [Thiobacillus sp.]